MRKEEFSTLPKLVQQYLVYIEAIKGHSEKSVLEYASDLRTFFRYIVKLPCGRPRFSRRWPQTPEPRPRPAAAHGSARVRLQR